MNPRMLVEFVDGSKTMVEMAAIANATGLVPDKPGMHGPKADRDDLAKVLYPARGRRRAAPQGRGRLHHRQGRGAGRLRHRGGHASAHHRAHGRPECRPGALLQLLPALPSDLARSAADGRAHHALRPADMVPLPRPVAEVCAVAKRDLAAGETFDAIGETCYRSWTMTVDDARASQRRSGRPSGGRQGAEAGEEGRTAHHRQFRARPHHPPLRPAPQAGRDALWREGIGGRA